MDEACVCRTAASTTTTISTTTATAENYFYRRRRRRRRLHHRLIHVAITAATTCVVVVSASNNNNNNNNQQQQQQQNLGYHDVQTVCRRSPIQVTGLWLTCDTPGAYYYGGSAYRNSEVCMSGDKANLMVDFHIPYEIGNTIGLKIESGLYDSFQIVKNITSLCQDETVTATYEGGNGNGGYQECPQPGYYTLCTTYTIPSLRDFFFHYTPDLKLTFANDRGRRIGCASTGTAAMRQAADRKATEGLVALGISVVAFVIIFALLLYLSYRRKKRLEQTKQNQQQQSRKSYHYFRTLPNGQVVPLPAPNTHHASMATARRLPPQQQQQQTIIGNPAYNETQIPTRPII